jgi:hypothetical protein
MSHGYGWRDSCAAGGVTDMAVGSGDWLALSNLIDNFAVSRYIFSANLEVPRHTIDAKEVQAGREEDPTTVWIFEPEPALTNRPIVTPRRPCEYRRQSDNGNFPDFPAITATPVDQRSR